MTDARKHVEEWLSWYDNGMPGDEPPIPGPEGIRSLLTTLSAAEAERDVLRLVHEAAGKDAEEYKARALAAEARNAELETLRAGLVKRMQTACDRTRAVRNKNEIAVNTHDWHDLMRLWTTAKALEPKL